MREEWVGGMRQMHSLVSYILESYAFLCPLSLATRCLCSSDTAGSSMCAHAQHTHHDVLQHVGQCCRRAGES